MSAESLQRVADAIASHLNETDDEHAVLTDWFVAYGSMRSDADSPSGISHGMHYATSDSSPQGVLGIAQLGVASLHDDLAGPDED